MKTPNESIAKLLKSLPLRGVGPAVMGGRIIDIAVHPTNPHIWYVAAGSGGVWKTTNAGTTWTAVFEKEASYSIGCVDIDPSNPNVVWVGTGENVSGRHVAWGDGVYKSRDGGKTWQNMGLKRSEHIGNILIDPRDGNVVYVAAEGPLWSSGGERGVFKTTDGGETWTAVLTIDDDTGVTDLAFAPDNPDTIYAAAYQRRRHTWALMAGGKGSGLYKSDDAGENWRKLSEGLPKGEMGKIGLSVTPADPSLVFATIEADDKEKGFYRSTNRGQSWEKRSDYISGGTGPHYYQVIEASPTDPNKIYQMDVFLHVTKDGGKTFKQMEDLKNKHSDNHALWIDPTNGDHLIVGCDAGVYESFDDGVSWRHVPNLPISQFYRVAVDNSEPFYNILGGAQDLGTLYGPAATMNEDGVRNRDWTVPIGADGYHVAFDPEEPHIAYMEFQVGRLFRYDFRSNETAFIQPQASADEPPERWNWDGPFVISPHDNKTLYFGSQRVWKTTDRGHSWTAVSGDLTRNQNRYEMELLGRVHSVDALYGNTAMSFYSTITSVAESALQEGLLLIGTDDGLIQISEDGGSTWRQASPLPDVPELAFINDVEPSRHDANTIYAIADAHKLGNYAPYLFVSHDLGQTWRDMSGDLPDGTILWQIQQDHLQPNLFFAAGEYGLYVTLNGGDNWHKLEGPTIAHRDLAIQRRDGDVVGASFGRGFFVLDDYAPLREVASGAIDDAKAHLFEVRDAWWYLPYTPMQMGGEPTLGTTAFKAKNPPFGATFTYYLAEDVQTGKQKRREAEKELAEAGENIPFPGWETLHQETAEIDPQLLLIVKDSSGQPIRRLEGKAKAGLHRVSWDLREATPNPISLKKEMGSPWMGKPVGPLVPPGDYSVELLLVTSAGTESLSAPQSFSLKPVDTLPEGMDATAGAAFQKEAAELMRQVMGAGQEVVRAQSRLKHIQAALIETPAADNALFTQASGLHEQLTALHTAFVENKLQEKFNEPGWPSMQGEAGMIFWQVRGTRQAPTATQQRLLTDAEARFATLKQELEARLGALEGLETAVADAGAPWTPGRKL